MGLPSGIVFIRKPQLHITAMAHERGLRVTTDSTSPSPGGHRHAPSETLPLRPADPAWTPREVPMARRTGVAPAM